MKTINLLRHQQKKENKTPVSWKLIYVIPILIIINLLLHIQKVHLEKSLHEITSQLEHQKSVNDELEKSLKNKEEQMKHQEENISFLKKMTKLPMLLPNGVLLKEVNLEEGNLKIKGFFDSSDQIEELQQNLKIDISSIKIDKKHHLFFLTLT